MNKDHLPWGLSGRDEGYSHARQRSTLPLPWRELLIRCQHLLHDLQDMYGSAEDSGLPQDWFDHYQLACGLLETLSHAALVSNTQQPQASQNSVMDYAEKLTTELHRRQRQCRYEFQFIEKLTGWIEGLIDGSNRDLSLVRQIAYHLWNQYTDGTPTLNWLSVRWDHPAQGAASHGWNCARLLCWLLPMHEGLETPPVEILAAALVHEAGIAALPPTLLNKNQIWSSDEHALLLNHPVQAADAIRRLNDPDAESIADAVLMHHERLDGSGYPRHHKEELITPAARWLALVDTYATLITDRPQRPGMTPRAALITVLNEAQAGRLTTELATVLAQFSWGLPGSLVELSDGHVAEVISYDPELPLRPTIRILGSSFPSNSSVIDLRWAQRLHIVRSLPFQNARSRLLQPQRLTA